MTKKVSRSQEIAVLKNSAEHWQVQFYEKERQNEMLVRERDRLQNDLNDARRSYQEASHYWHQWTLVNRENIDDPNGTVRFPIDALNQLLRIFK